MPTTVVFQCFSRQTCQQYNEDTTLQILLNMAFHLITWKLEAQVVVEGLRVTRVTFAKIFLRNVKKSNTAPPKQTVRTCQEAIPKGKKSSSNHELSGASC